MMKINTAGSRSAGKAGGGGEWGVGGRGGGGGNASSEEGNGGKRCRRERSPLWGRCGPRHVEVEAIARHEETCNKHTSMSAEPCNIFHHHLHGNTMGG